jgi:hypothetical protein
MSYFAVQLSMSEATSEETMGRLFSFVGLVAVMAVGMYIYSKQLPSSATGGTANPQDTVNITGVKNDLLSIAQAERGYIATEGKYAPLDDLISGHYITINKQRPPFSYDIESTSNGFRVTATRSGPGSPARMWIDETMEIQFSD